MALLAKNHLSDVVGLKNDIVAKVFTCPDCKTDVTISKWQLAGELQIMCTRCNCKWAVKGEELLDLSPQGADYYPERIVGGKIVKQSIGYKVYMHADATQKAAPIPKDSFINVMKPPAVVPKPPVAAPVAGAPTPAAPLAAPASPAAAPAAPAVPPAAPGEGGAA